MMTQIARVMAINQLEAITPDVVHARQILVIGASEPNSATKVSQLNRPFTVLVFTVGARFPRRSESDAAEYQTEMASRGITSTRMAYPVGARFPRRRG